MTGDGQTKTRIFVSYSHADTAPRPRVNSSRLGELLAELRYDLGADTSRSIYHFLRDTEGALNPSDQIAATLSGHIQDCHIGLVFLSQHYCRSDSCGSELRQLLDLGKPVIAVELDEEFQQGDFPGLADLRARMADIISVRFWEDRPGIPLHFGYPLPSTSDGDSLQGYRTCLLRLREGIKDAANELRQSGTAESVPEELPEGRFDVIMAAPVGDAKPLADRLERALLEEDLTVLRLDRLHGLSTEKIRGCVGARDVFVQVLGFASGREAEELGNRSPVVAQHEIATEQQAAVVAWVPEDIDPADCSEAYGAFLSRVLTHRTSFEDFEKYAVQLARTNKRESEAETRRKQIVSKLSFPNLPLISLDAAAVDAALRDRIKDALDDHVIVDSIRYDVDMDSLEEAVQSNDAILLVYGAQPEGQKRAAAHFRIFRRLLRTGSREVQQRFRIAFGDASPQDAIPCPTGPDIHVIRVDEAVDPVAMERFLDSLRDRPAQDALG